MKKMISNGRSRLRKSSEYQNVYAKGRRLQGERFSLIYALNNQKERRLGISVHGYRGAVKRNRIKRIIREFYRLNRSLFQPSIDIVFAVRQGFSLKNPQEIEQAVRILLKKQASFEK